jgi:hypothetical protein
VLVEAEYEKLMARPKGRGNTGCVLRSVLIEKRVEKSAVGHGVESFVEGRELEGALDSKSDGKGASGRFRPGSLDRRCGKIHSPGLTTAAILVS